MEFKDYYATLGVERGAPQADIKRAYRKLARKYHPDVSREPDAEARFKDLAEAHEALIDPERRAAYDDIAQRHARGQPFEPPPGWDSGFEFSGRGVNRAAGRPTPGDAKDVPYVFDPTINLLSLVFSAVIGVLFGYFPARRAARMDPIEALRHG